MKTQLGRKVYKHIVRTSDMPEELKAVFKITEEENHFGIKGGYAKAALRYIFRHDWKGIGNERYNNMDLDIVLTYVGLKTKSTDALIERVANLSEKLSRVNVALDPSDIELIKGNLDDPEVIQDFMESRDLTLNEVLLVPQENGKWKLYWTDKCDKDNIKKVGILSANGAGTTRIDSGRMIATPAGITRLLRFLIERKVKKIYLPDWWIEANNKEAKRMKKENLGVYGLILGQRYRNDPELQKRMMAALNTLGITDIRNFEQYMTEQKTFYKLWTGNDFKFDQNRSFEEIQKHLLEKKENGESSRKEQTASRESCEHEVETIECSHCAKKCTIKKCARCTAFEVFYKDSSEPLLPRNLLCNYNFRVANFYWDKEGFF